MLEWNCIGLWERGMNSLADSLSINHTLKTLDLRNNKIGPNEITVLASALKYNTSLEKLGLFFV